MGRYIWVLGALGTLPFICCGRWTPFFADLSSVRDFLSSINAIVSRRTVFWILRGGGWTSGNLDIIVDEDDSGAPDDSMSQDGFHALPNSSSYCYDVPVFRGDWTVVLYLIFGLTMRGLLVQLTLRSAAVVEVTPPSSISRLTTELVP